MGWREREGGDKERERKIWLFVVWTIRKGRALFFLSFAESLKSRASIDYVPEKIHSDDLKPF